MAQGMIAVLFFEKKHLFHLLFQDFTYLCGVKKDNHDGAFV